MRIPWTPILLCAVAADVNFWYYASVGENHADYFGIALFLGLALYFIRRAAAERSPGLAVAVVGCLAAAALMAAREYGVFDRGYILPYAVLIVFLFAAGAVSGAAPERSSARSG